MLRTTKALRRASFVTQKNTYVSKANYVYDTRGTIKIIIIIYHFAAGILVFT